MMSKNSLYIGKAGHFAVMSEFLMLGWNVAIPEVDVGDDIFVVRDGDGQLIRVQVKSAQAGSAPTKKVPNRLKAQFSAKWGQLSEAKTPDLTYVFVVRHQDNWLKFLVLERALIYQYYLTSSPVAQNYESKRGMTVQIQFELGADGTIQRATFLGNDVTGYISDYSRFPKITH